MAFFRKKEAQAPNPARKPENNHHPLSEIICERVITAEGWRRKNFMKATTVPKKGAVK